MLYAIRNGGFSGAIMPQNIVVGDDAQEVAQFLAKYSGLQAPKVPSSTNTSTLSTDNSTTASAIGRDRAEGPGACSTSG